MIVVTGVKFIAKLEKFLEKHSDHIAACSYSVTMISNREELDLLQNIRGQCLICFNTGIIIPPKILDAVGRESYNFHAAPPEFPGRDPHHWAINRGANRFGATCHVMTQKVDDGPIIAVHRFDIPPKTSPKALATLAVDAAAVMFDALLPGMLKGDLVPGDFQWGALKTTREGSIRMRGEKGFEDFKVPVGPRPVRKASRCTRSNQNESGSIF